MLSNKKYYPWWLYLIILVVRLNPERGYGQNSMKDRTGSLVSAVMLPSPVPLQPEHLNPNYTYRIFCVFNGEARRHCMTGSTTSTICFSILRCCRQPLGWSSCVFDARRVLYRLSIFSLLTRYILTWNLCIVPEEAYLWTNTKGQLISRLRIETSTVVTTMGPGFMICVVDCSLIGYYKKVVGTRVP